MSDPALIRDPIIEAAAQALAKHWQKCVGEDGENDDEYPPNAWLIQAEVVVAAVTPLILERAAKVAEGFSVDSVPSARKIAAAIRALKEQP